MLTGTTSGPRAQALGSRPALHPIAVAVGLPDAKFTRRGGADSDGDGVEDRGPVSGRTGLPATASPHDLQEKEPGNPRARRPSGTAVAQPVEFPVFRTVAASASQPPSLSASALAIRGPGPRAAAAERRSATPALRA
jgi:hypothetical protein